MDRTRHSNQCSYSSTTNNNSYNQSNKQTFNINSKAKITQTDRRLISRNGNDTSSRLKLSDNNNESNNDIEIGKSANKTSSCANGRIRLLIVIITTLCPTVCYMSRANLSLAIVAMVEDPITTKLFMDVPPIQQPGNVSLPLPNISSTESKILNVDDNNVDYTKPRVEASIVKTQSANSKLAEDDDDKDKDKDNTSKKYGPKYSWSEFEKGLVKGAFFLSYVIFQIPIARFAEIIGAKWILATATLGSCILSFLTPLAASCSATMVVVLRLAMGSCQTALYPAAYILYCKWLPRTERSIALPILNAAAYLGMIVSGITTGYLCQNEAYGWEYAFYLSGCICGLWSLAWILIGSSTPALNKYIGSTELCFIESELKIEKLSSHDGDTMPLKATKLVTNDKSIDIAKLGDGDNDDCADDRLKPISWSKLLASESVWALIYAFFGSNWSLSLVLLNIPTYLNSVIHISTLNNGLITACIYGLYCICCAPVGTISTMMVETRAFGLNQLQVRKLFQSIALFGQALCYISLPFFSDVKSVLCLLILQVFLSSFINGGEVQLPTELSPQYSGTIFALCNSVGSSTGFILPVIQSFLVKDEKNEQQWASFFYLTALVMTFTGSVFLIFGKNSYIDFSKDEKNYSNNSQANKKTANIYAKNNHRNNTDNNKSDLYLTL